MILTFHNTTMQNLKKITEKRWFIPIGLLSPLLILIIGYILFPSIIYDKFIWKYFWGPITSDALSQHVSHNGIAAAQKFTLVSEIVYGILVVIALYGLMQILKKWDIKIDTTFFIAILPYVIYGSVVRVLEDAEFFTEPLVYWFVTPLVYFQTLFWFLLILLIGIILSKKIKHKLITPINVVFVGGLCLLTPFIYITSLWMQGHQWSYSNGVRLDIFILVSFILFTIILAVYGVCKYFKRYPWLIIYTGIINLSMIFGHMLDGFASWISIYDPLKMGLPAYIEKHPASDMLMQIWPPLFPIVKFLLIIVVIYIFDIIYKKDFEEYPRLVPLLKIGIFILGFAPGLRDLLRVCMGV